MSKVQSNNRDTGFIDELTIAGEGSAVLSGTYKMQSDKRRSGCIADFVAFASPPLTNLWGWWNASNAYTDSGKTTLCSSSGSATCHTLADLSGNGRDLVQSTSGNRPTWYSSQLNGYPALLFDGSNDVLSITGQNISAPYAFIMVFKVPTYTNSDRYCCIGSSTSNSSLWYYDSSSSANLDFYSGRTPDVNIYAAKTADFMLAMSNLNGASSFFKINNNADSTGTGFAVSGATTVALGDCPYDSTAGNMYFCEALVYNASMASGYGDGLLARQYLNAKYNLGLTL